MISIEHKFVETNGINVHFAEAGVGPPVLLLHGFPETWYSWRNQLLPLAESGWHVIAPDQRGYGQSDCPASVDSYDVFHLTADMVGLVQSLGFQRAGIVGNDWGSIVAAHCALLRTDIFKVVALLSVPYIPRIWGKHTPTEFMRRVYRGKNFYQLYVQEQGKAESELENDIRNSLLMMLYSLSGDAEPEKRWKYVFGQSETILDTGGLPEKLPSWLSENDLAAFVADFSRTGFRGALNWYRNIDRNWALTAFLAGARIEQPSVFLAGERDPILTLYRNYGDALGKSMPNLRRRVLLPDTGHWTMQEKPEEVNQVLIDFLNTDGTQQIVAVVRLDAGF
jgi:pimeloyl-ACP methyl ester carboxylesterase